MTRRPGTRPLYELMVRGQGGPARTPPSDTPPVDTPVNDSLGVLAGRSIRVPLGYLLLTVAGFVVAVVAAYLVGSSQGRESMRLEYEPILSSGGLVDPAQWAQDPLNGRAASPEPAANTSAGAEGPGERAPTDARAADDGPAPIDTDPRRDGLFYLVLAETRPEGAIRLAEFCREHGLEAYVIRSHNPRRRRVITLPGLPSSSETDPDYRRLYEQVLRVGQAWKTRYPGDGDLSDAYPIQ